MKDHLHLYCICTPIYTVRSALLGDEGEGKFPKQDAIFTIYFVKTQICAKLL